MAGFGDPAIGGVVDILYDGEVPRSFNGRARQVISGGQFVTISGAAQAVGSIAALYNTGSLVVDLLTGDENQVVGVAAKNTGSNGIVPVLTSFTGIATVGGVISGGYPVKAISGTVQYVTNAVGVAGSSQPVGRAWSASASGTNLYSLVKFNF